MLTPILHRLLVKPDDAELTSKGGIVLAVDPKKERQAVEKGLVLAIGETAFMDFTKERECTLPKVGDRIYYAKYAGKTVKDNDDKEYLMLNDEDVIAIIN